MLLLIALGGLVAYTPTWLCDENGAPREGAPVYHVKAGSVIERAQFEGLLAAPPYLAREVYGFELAAAAAAGVEALAPAGDRGRIAQILGLKQAGTLDNDPADRALWDALEPVLIEGWPAYAALKAFDARREQVLPVLAAKWFLRMVNGEPVAIGADGMVADADLAAVPALELRMAGLHAYSLLYAAAHAKKSEPRPKSGPIRAASRSAKKGRSAKVF